MQSTSDRLAGGTNEAWPAGHESCPCLAQRPATAASRAHARCATRAGTRDARASAHGRPQGSTQRQRQRQRQRCLAGPRSAGGGGGGGGGDGGGSSDSSGGSGSDEGTHPTPVGSTEHWQATRLDATPKRPLLTRVRLAHAADPSFDDVRLHPQIATWPASCPSPATSPSSAPPPLQ
jgi:hypothetical protein